MNEETTDPVIADAVAHHDPQTHMDVRTSLSDDDHRHAGEPLGPIDWQKWAFAIIGGICGLMVLVFFAAAIS